MSSQIVHMSLDIIGALSNWVDHEWEGVLIADDGRRLSASEARRALFLELGKGRYKLPIGECEGFDFGQDGGCPGHPCNED